MADLTAFSSQSFNAAKWINSSLIDRADEDALESYLASLAMKLHIISQDYTDQLETGMVEAMSTMPKVLSEISRIEEGLRNVETEMNGLARHLHTFDQRNVVGVEDLSRLDTLKSNMENCNATLEEHARWSQVVREAKHNLDIGGRFSDSADRIEIMFHSLEVLHNLPGHEERLETYESLRNALLAVLRPRVQNHILAVDLAPLHEYFYVYEKLGRISELEEEYVNARPERLKHVWEKYSTSEPFAPWLAIYFGKVASLLTEEFANASALFGANRTSEVLIRLLEHALSNLAEPLSQRLIVEDSPLVAMDAYVLADEFIRKVVHLFHDCSAQRFLSVLTAVFPGFEAYLECYGEREGEHVRKQLDADLNSVEFKTSHSSSLLEIGGDHSDITDFSRDEDMLNYFHSFAERMLVIADSSFDPSSASIERAVKFMGGLRAKNVLRAVAAAMANFVKLLTSKVELLKVAAGVNSRSLGGNRGTVQPIDFSLVSSESYDIALQFSQQLESSDARGKAALVPISLIVLQATGRLCRRLRDLESLAVDRLYDLLNAIFRDNSSDRFQGIFPKKELSVVAEEDDASSASFSSFVDNQSSMGTVYACYVLQNEPGLAAELRSFLTASSSHHTSQTVFASTSAPLSRLKASAGTLLFDLCLSNPERILSFTSTDDIWGFVDVDKIENNNQLPRLAITQVGEHLLSLVQELETFASSDALSDLLALSGEVTNQFLAARGWRQLKTILDLNEEEGIEQLCKRSTCASAISAAEKIMFGMQLSRLSDESMVLSDESSESGFGGPEIVREPEDDDSAALSFVNEWLGAITDSTIGLLLAQITQIQSLTSSGRSQLVVDIEYMSNVIQAMGLRQHPILFHLRHLLLRDPQTLAAPIDIMPGRSAVLAALQKIDAKISSAISKGDVSSASIALDTELLENKAS